MPLLLDPYKNMTGGEWLRGNLHAHSTRSDGERDPGAVIADYARRGYGFFMMSDHDRLATEEDYAGWGDAKGMVLIPGIEITAGGPHLLHVDARSRVEPSTIRQEVLCAILDQAERTGHGFCIVNHPNWGKGFDHCSLARLSEWMGYCGLEIFNGVIGRLYGSAYATDKWDMLLTAGRRVWGFANDDCHQARGDTELGWNVAYVRERTCAGVVEALRTGRFYGSSGVVIASIEVDGMTLRIKTENGRRVAAIVDSGRRLRVADAASLEMQVPDDCSYVRFECWGEGEQMAWTQPFFIEA